MNPEEVFKAANMFAAFGWLILIVLYNHRLTAKIVLGGIVVSLAILYIYLVITGLGEGKEGGGFGSLPAVMILFTSPKAVLAGWVHYLAFDLTIGLFITLNSAKQGINRWIMLPCQFFTFMLGPSGLLLYFIMLCIKQRTASPVVFEPGQN